MTPFETRHGKFAFVSAAFLVAASAVARGQEIRIGDTLPFAGTLNPPRTQTAVSLIGANTGGFVTSATFGWSATGCPAAVEIKFFRPLSGGFFNFVTQRGPFDVTNPLLPGLSVPPFTQTVALDPPVAVREGDVIAITNLTSCGGPALSSAPAIPLPLPPGSVPATLVLDGDVTDGVGPTEVVSTSTFSLFLSASGPARGLGLLNDRFEVNLLATNPRTGVSATGTARSLGNAAGYFSLPEFTGDSSFPEITVKMVDATTAPPPFGGAFWFFHSSLTDLTYTITVTDHLRGRTRTYTSSGTAFCGGADTNAFAP